MSLDGEIETALISEWWDMGSLYSGWWDMDGVFALACFHCEGSCEEQVSVRTKSNI